MNNRVRKSLPTKIAAIGFILMILMGNYWMVLVITNQPFPQWLMNLFLINAMIILMSAVGVAFVTIKYRYSEVPDEESDDE